MSNNQYIWQRPDWPSWRYDLSALAERLGQVHRAQGQLRGRMADFGLGLRDQATLQILTEDVLKTSEIEGEQLKPDAVRSSIAQRMGVDIGALAPSDRAVDGIVDMILDATQSYGETLTKERLFGWHAALFPTPYSGLAKIRVGTWRDDSKGPMQVVSGPIGRQRVHFEAPPADRLEQEIESFLHWFNSPTEGDSILKAGISHLWFVTLHPFDDGNGRIARAIGDMALARAEQSAQRFYSLSSQIQRERRHYYDHLEATQKGGMDITSWLAWFLECLLRATDSAETVLSAVLAKARFWQQWSGVTLNIRQTMMLNRLLDGFEGKLTNKKWATLAKCSPDTALRDITSLLEQGILVKSGSGGRSTSYDLKEYSPESVPVWCL